MQQEKAQRIRASWGDKQCDHPSIEKEYYYGSATMDFVCSTCGAEFTSSEKDKIEADRNFAN